MKHVVMGTAGHVDHGKTSLIKALTGTDCDRLAEEKEREITIDIGFARMDGADGSVIGVVDVPGHERFIKNMLAGVSGIDFVLMVVAADDGVMPQTLEHLDICNLLGIQKGVIALTKIDLVEPDWVEMMAEEVSEAMKGTFMEGAPVCPVSSADGRGIEELAETIRKAAAAAVPRNEWGLTRLPVDRAFTMKGAGAVVTGTLISGTLRLDQELELLPQGRRARVRQIQSHGKKTTEAGAGRRVAVNIVGVDVEEISRGDVLAQAGAAAAALTIDAAVRAAPRLSRPLKNRSRVRIHIGAQELFGRLSLLDCEKVESGGEALARIRLDSPAVCAHKDAFIIRSFSAMETIGGGVVLDAAPNLKRRPKEEICADLRKKLSGSADDSVEQAVRDFALDAPAVKDISIKINMDPETVSELARSLVSAGRLVEAPEPGRLIAVPALERFKSEIISRMKEYFGLFSKKPWVSRRELKTKYFGKTDNKVYEFALEALEKEGRALTSASGRGVRHAEGSEAALAEEARLREAISSIYAEKQFNAPDADEVAAIVKSDKLDVAEVYNTLVEAGTLVKLGPRAYLHSEAVEAARAKVVGHLEQHGKITVAEARDILGTSRKFSVPLMEYFDRVKVTFRQGDERIAYPFK
jgi:selenocysteine-specific elongation factor